MSCLDHKARLVSLKGEIADRRLDAFLVTNEANVSYLSGFWGHDSILLITKTKQFFITDSRYIEDARQTTKGFDVRLVNASTYTTLQGIIKKGGINRVGFESMNLPYEVAARLQGLLNKTKFTPIKDLIETLRAIKDEGEIGLMRDAVKLTERVMDKVMHSMAPGMEELELARRVELGFIAGGGKAAFEPIAASGKNSSKPHARAGHDIIKNNSFVMVDIGCNLNGYCADMTRMAVLGKTPERFKKIYSIVRKAQELAIKGIRPGARVDSVDTAARRHIEKEGFGKNFGHSLGHGVGLDVHEEPTVSYRNESILKPGMVFTVEPAIYIPGFGGARVEDMVLVTNKGCEVLTK